MERNLLLIGSGSLNMAADHPRGVVKILAMSMTIICSELDWFGAWWDADQPRTCSGPEVC
jgi:hypothetical protein